jgi:hypothetical protein
MTTRNNKFAYRDQTVKEIESLVQVESYRLSNKYTNETFTPEHITECPRRIVYRSLGQISELPSSYLTFSHADKLQDKWVEFLRRCKSVQVIDSKAVVSDWERNLSGIVDIVIKYDDIIYGIQVQGVTPVEFDKIRINGAMKKHVITTMAKLWMIEKQDGLLIYDNQIGDFCMFRVVCSEPILHSVAKKCQTLLQHKLRGDLPGRPYKDKSAKECTQCEYAKACWV